MSMVTPRSYLFVPGNRPERFEKARSASADAVIFDLEDAVPAEQKCAARDAVRQHLDAQRPAIVRVNAPGSPFFDEDLRQLAAHPGVAAIMLPKAETTHEIERVLITAHAALDVIPLIETAHGFANLSALCQAPRVARVAFGTLDFQIDLGLDGDSDALLTFRSQIVLASRLAAIASPIDGVSPTLDDADLIEGDTRRAKRLGFGAKLCIHPQQIDPVHRGFAWSPAEIEWAGRVLARGEASGGAAISVDGKMVDMPVIRRARRISGMD
jgi:citrate lyase subunit beta/citryl-CoA lyase